MQLSYGSMIDNLTHRMAGVRGRVPGNYLADRHLTPDT